MCGSLNVCVLEMAYVDFCLCLYTSNDLCGVGLCMLGVENIESER